MQSLRGIDNHYNTIIITSKFDGNEWKFAMPTEVRTARLTILIDPRKKAFFEELCAENDVTPSQVVRKLIRGYIEQQTGKPWDPKDHELPRTYTKRTA